MYACNICFLEHIKSHFGHWKSELLFSTTTASNFYSTYIQMYCIG